MTNLEPLARSGTSPSRAMAVTAIAVEGLACQRGGRIVVEPLSFKVRSGNALVLRGPNGAGKTTLLRTIAGYLRPASGRVRVSGPKGDTSAFPERTLNDKGSTTMRPPRWQARPSTAIAMTAIARCAGAGRRSKIRQNKFSCQRAGAPIFMLVCGPLTRYNFAGSKENSHGRSVDNFHSRKTLKVEGKDYEYFSLPDAEANRLRHLATRNIS